MISQPYNPNTLKTFLEGETSTTGSLDDLLRAYYISQGASVGSIQDLERQVLLQNTTGGGSNADLWNKYFSENSLTSVADWITQGGFSSFSTVLENFTALSGETPFAFHDFNANVYGKPALGANAATNGDFATGDLTGWESSTGSVTFDGGAARLERDGVNAVLIQTVSIPGASSGDTIRVCWDQTVSGSGTQRTRTRIRNKAGGADLPGGFIYHSGTGFSKKELYLTLIDDGILFQIWVENDGTIAHIDNISVELVDTSLDPISAAVSDILSYTKGSAKLVLNTSGTYDTVAAGADIARSYNPGAAKTGLLIEDTATNYSPNSVPGIGWVDVSSSISDAGAGAVDGQNAAYLTVIAGTGAKTPYALELVSVGFGQRCFYAIVEEPENTLYVALQTQIFDAGANGITIFDLSTETIKSQTHDDSGIINIGNGLFIIYAVFETTSDDSGRVNIGLTENETSMRITDPTGNERIKIHHVQVEDGTYPTSPIITTGATATRLVDDAEGADLLANAVGSLDEWSYYWEGIVSSDGACRIMNAHDGTETNRVIVDVDTSGKLRLVVSASATLTCLITDAVSFPKNTRSKVGMRVEANNFALFLNGTKIGEDTSGGVPTNIDQIHFGQGPTGNLRCKSLTTFSDAFYDTALSDSDLVGLTT